MRPFIDSQKVLSQAFDRILPAHYRIDGNHDFEATFAPPYLRAGITVYDVGGGKSPLIDPEVKSQLGLKVIGIDIDPDELDRADRGCYDRAICADITRYVGDGDGDLVICRALLEHVHNVEAALDGIASLLKPGGAALIFVPSRNAVFARLNLLLPEDLKRRVLFAVHPGASRKQGFPAFYDRCTPRDFRSLAQAHDLRVEAERFYYQSSYMTCFLPAHVAWRLWVLGFRLVARDQAAETFCMAFRKAA